MTTKRTIGKIEKEIEALIAEGEALANETGETFDVLGETFYPGSKIKEMCDEDSDNYTYLDDWYASEYGESGHWMGSSDFC